MYDSSEFAHLSYLCTCAYLVMLGSHCRMIRYEHYDCQIVTDCGNSI